MLKRFHKTSEILFTYNTVDTATLGDPDPTFTRAAVVCSCHPGVNASDIVSEVTEKLEEQEQQELLDVNNDYNPILTTTIQEHADVVTAMTLGTFLRLAKERSPKDIQRVRIDRLANYLVFARDNKDGKI